MTWTPTTNRFGNVWGSDTIWRSVNRPDWICPYCGWVSRWHEHHGKTRVAEPSEGIKP